MQNINKRCTYRYLSTLACLMFSFLLIGCATSQNSIALSSQNTNMTKEKEIASLLGHAPINAPIILPQSLVSSQGSGQVSAQVPAQVSAIVDKEYTSALGMICRQVIISYTNSTSHESVQHLVAVCKEVNTEEKNSLSKDTRNQAEYVWQLMPFINDIGLWEE